MKRRALVILSACVVLLHTHRTDACELAVGDVHMADAAEVFEDTRQPVILGDSDYSVFELGVPGCRTDECDGVLVMRLDLEATDDRSPIELIGFELVVTSGSIPTTLPTRAVRGDSFFGDTAQLTFDWDDQFPVQATLQVTPIDLGGNRGAPIEIEISEAANSDFDDFSAHATGGCRIDPGSSSLQALLLAMLVAALVFRQRRPRYDGRDETRRLRAPRSRRRRM